MPIFMDRHDVSAAVTAEAVAQLHQQDLKVQDKYGCRGLTYWFDDLRKTAFCLIEAPDMKALQKMHLEAHGDVPNQIIEVEPSIVESFLGRIQDPVKAKNTALNIINDPAFRTLMVISVNRLEPEKKDGPVYRKAAVNFQRGVRKIIETQKGTTVKQTDDNWLVSFKSVTRAVHAAKDIHTLHAVFSKQKKEHKSVLKIALNTGVPVTEKPSIFEDTIKLAERMCGIVKGGIILSAEVRDLYKSENANTFISGKNIRALSPADEKFISLLMDYNDKAWNNANFKAVDFIRPSGCSKSQLYRKMISLTGQSPNAFIKEYRLKEALKLFRNSSLNISEIAFETGFSSPSYFSTCFQKRFGHPPSDYLTAQSA